MASLAQLYRVSDEIEKIFKKIDYALLPGRRSNLIDNEYKELIACTDIAIDRAKQLLSDLEAESKKRPQVTRTILELIPQHKNKIESYENKIRDLRFSMVKEAISRESLTLRTPSIEEEIQKQVIETAASLERTTESIARSHIVAVESEEIGEAVISDLGVQRESLQRTRDHLDDTTEHLSRSKKLIKAIKLGIIQNKILLYCIIFLETFILVAVIYWKFFSSGALFH